MIHEETQKSVLKSAELFAIPEEDEMDADEVKDG